MQARNTPLTLVIGALLLAGCDANAPELLSPQGPDARWQDGQKMVPIEWTFHVWATAEPTVPCLAPDGSVAGAVPPTYAVSGRLTHMGRLDEEASAATIHDCAMTMGEGGPEVSGSITAHLVGPQDDAVDLAGTLTLMLAAGYAAGDWDVVGGEGRFAGATGYIESTEYPAADGSGSAGSGAGMISQPQPVEGGRD